MKEDRTITTEPIELDPSELLGFSQVAKVSGVQGEPGDLGRLLSKIGLTGETGNGLPSQSMGSLLARLQSKISGEVPPPVGKRVG